MEKGHHVLLLQRANMPTMWPNFVVDMHAYMDNNFVAYVQPGPSKL